jgi:hypothetical protein
VGWLLVGWGFRFYYEDWEFDDDDQKNMTGHAEAEFGDKMLMVGK